jgi:hypothetical protein
VTDQKKCRSARRHMTPVQFMVYDSMLHFAAPPDRLFFSTIIGVANNTNLCKDTVDKTIKELVTLGWLIPDPDNTKRFRNTGRWANFRYTVVTHEQHKADCPSWKYDPETGKNLTPAKRRGGYTVPTASDRTYPTASDRTYPTASESTYPTASEQALELSTFTSAPKP